MAPAAERHVSPGPAGRVPLGTERRVAPGTAVVLSTASFVAYALALPGRDLWPLAFVAFVPLALALRGQPPGRAVGIAMAGGFVGICIGFSWLLGTLEVFGRLPRPLAVLAMGALCLYQSGRFGLWAWLAARATRHGWPAWTSFVLAFVASELLYPLLFPWYLAVTVHPIVPLIQVAELGGPILVGLVVLSASVGLAELATARREGRRPARAPTAAALVVPALAWLYGHVRIGEVDAAAAAAPAVTIGIAQGNVPMGTRQSSLEQQLRLTRELRAQGAELVVWSESGLSVGFQESRPGDIERLVGTRLGGPALIHATLRLPRDPAAGARSRAVSASLLLDDQGRIAGRYDKQKLLMFGEYLPLGAVFPRLYAWSPNTGRFVPGTSDAPLVWRGRRMTVLICYEDILPSLVNRMVARGKPDLLVNQTNDVWFLDTAEPWIHLGLAKFRAVEHRRCLVRATNSGVSAIVDPVGRVVVRGGTFKEETLVGKVRFMSGRTVYQSVGDAPWWIVSAAAIGAALVPRRRMGPVRDWIKARWRWRNGGR
jgi:apolipoprotein N-acyltransferase